jgi:hypothetical protein
MGFEASFFQYAQNLPIEAGSFPFPDDQVDATNTTAVVVLTVYPRPTPWDIPAAEIEKLADQCARLNKEAKRRILLRFAPEMNGNWNYWGQQPTNFIALWIRVYNAVKAKAPNTGFIWAPSYALNYPYGRVQATSAPDIAALDTNKDGVVNGQDDPFSPYYPGDQYVDWVGMSIYTYGSTFPWSDNVSAPPGKFDASLNQGNFYQTYSVAKGKPFMITETAATFHVNTPLGPGVGEVETKRSWWRQYITNATFLQTHPMLKGICLFEFLKYEEFFANGQPSLRDFRHSNKTEVREAFLQDFATVKNLYELEVNTFRNPQFTPPNGVFNTGSKPGSGSGSGSRNAAMGSQHASMGVLTVASLLAWSMIAF